MDALAQTTLLALSIETLHSVLNLIDGLLLAVETLYADKIEGIAQQIALDGHIEG